MSERVVETSSLSHYYGERLALEDLSLSIERGQLFALLGPNGGGKSTLFKILTTLMKPTSGSANILGHDVVREPARVRELIGITFQAPSLDAKLTVRENLVHQGHLYGLRGARLKGRVDELLEMFGLQDRTRDAVETLSGGLARRVDLAKALLHRPILLLLDEPSTGLDPVARADLLRFLQQARDEDGMSCLLTTHLMEEAEHCDGVGILDYGKLVAQGTPEELVREIGGEVLTLAADSPERLAQRIEAEFGPPVFREDGIVRLERENAAELLPRLISSFSDVEFRSATVSRPTLEDVFFHKTGRTYREESS